MPGSEELKDLARIYLSTIDQRAVFWIDTVVLTQQGSSSADVDWTTLDWTVVREELNDWLSGLDPDLVDPSTPEAVFEVSVPERDDVRLLFRAKPRSPQWRGQAREPSLVIGERTPIPALQFDDGSSASLYDLPIETVRELAAGERRLALELPSHRVTWQMLLEQMQHFGQQSTSEIEPLLLEPTASALGFVDAPDGLGDFDETWRLLHGVDFPITDDPRGDQTEG